MRAAAVSAAAWGVPVPRQITETDNSVSPEHVHSADGWNRQVFAEEQIRGLVRHVFSPGLNPAVQQVVFSSTESETNVLDLCEWVGEVLAREQDAEIAVIDETGNCGRSRTDPDVDGAWRGRMMPIRHRASRVHKNVWLVPARGSDRLSLGTYLGELRREFEYSIVAAPACTVSSEAVEMARLADGIILVLSAQRTRRITALKARNTLANVRLLGTVLSDREFPIPTNIYRRL